jgi:hypothetical protein
VEREFWHVGVNFTPKKGGKKEKEINETKEILSLLSSIFTAPCFSVYPERSVKIFVHYAHIRVLGWQPILLSYSLLLLLLFFCGRLLCHPSCFVGHQIPSNYITAPASCLCCAEISGTCAAADSTLARVSPSIWTRRWRMFGRSSGSTNSGSIRYISLSVVICCHHRSSLIKRGG